jgi:hypothetical protein
MNDTDLAFATVIVPYGHEKADTGLAGLDDIICGVIMLVGGTIAMALIRTERDAMRWASEMPEVAVGVCLMARLLRRWREGRR